MVAIVVVVASVLAFLIYSAFQLYTSKWENKNGRVDRFQMFLILSVSGNGSALNFYYKAAAYAGKGDSAGALAALQESFNKGFSDFAALDSSPHFVVLRSDPRFQQLVARYRR
jgi:Tfp pilus assembly protein PilE